MNDGTCLRTSGLCIEGAPLSATWTMSPDCALKSFFRRFAARVDSVFGERLRAERAGQAAPPMTVVHGLAGRYLVGRDDVTAVELARYLGITKQSTSEVVTALEHAGIVRRAPHPTDRRARVLLLSGA